MKILYIITLPDLAGAQVHLLEVISNLPNNITPYIIIGQQGWLTEKLEHIKDNIYIVPTMKRQISLYNDFKTIHYIIKIIDDITPDIVHCHSSKAGTVGRLAARIAGVPSIFTAHGWAFTEGVSEKKRWLYKKIEKMMARWTEKIICVSDYDKNLAVNVMPEYMEKLITIHNGISNFKIDRNIIRNDDCLNIIMIARFSPPKDQILLIEAIDELTKEGIQIKLTFVGDGPTYKRVKEYAKNKVCEKQITFLGARTNVEEIIVKQDVFVLTTNWEGLPISILEAMRQSLPVVASDVGGVKEAVFNRKNGYLIPRGDKNCLIEKIKLLYNNKELLQNMGHNSRSIFENNFLSSIMMKKTIILYNEIYIKEAARSNMNGKLS